MMPTLSIIQKIAIWVVPLLLAITLHEAMHAYVANRCGDSTAKMLGRLSLNPLRHIDPLGTILMPLLIGILTNFQFVFGWAKPVPINWNQLKKPRRDMALVAAAGPGANIAMALLWALIYKIATIFNPAASIAALFFLLTAQAGILINLILAILNSIPIPPLDGSRIVASFLPPKYSYNYLSMDRYGIFILLALLFTGVLGWIIYPLLSWSFFLIKTIFNL